MNIVRRVSVAIALCLAMLAMVGPSVRAARPPAAAVTPALLYAGMAGGGVYHDLDLAGPWSAAGALPSAVLSLAAGNAAHWHDVYAGLGDGVYVSHDQGMTWSATSIHGVAVRSLLLTTSGAILVATDRGVFSSDDQGATWIGAMGLPSGRAKALTQAQPQVNGAPTPPCLVVSAGAVWTSADEGAHWTLLLRALPGHAMIFALTASAAAPATVYAASASGLWRGAAGAWTPLHTPTVAGKPVALVAADASTIYVAARTDPTIYVSTDSGATWASRPIRGLSFPATALIGDPLLQGAIVVGSADGHVLRSNDGGTTWTDLASGDVTGAIGAKSILALTLVHRATLPTDGVPDPGPAPGQQWVADNGGHTVHEPILSYWLHYRALLGAPLSEAFTPDSTRPGVQMQVFATMEVQVQGSKVMPVALGKQELPNNAPSCPSTGCVTDTRFAAEARLYGDVIGSPISAVFMQTTDDGTGQRYIVQYFRNARLEYHSIGGSGVVVLGRLGVAVVQLLNQ